LGGITGHASDLGTAGRDGALLAVEQINQQGGIHGAVIKLHEFDDQQRPASVPKLFDEVKKSGVVAVVGPMTSSVAAAWIPLANQARLVTLSPTVTSSDFTGLDDYFFRVISDTRDYAQRSAASHTSDPRWRRFAAVLDETNASYTRSWLQHFRDAMGAQGAESVSQIGFGLPGSPTLAQTVESTVSAKPQAVVVIANAVDTARLVHLFRQHDPLMPLAGVEWSATDQLLTLGGPAVEGLFIAQFMDHQDQSETYLQFVRAFVRRFGRAPGFAELAAFDAMHVLLTSLVQQRPDESLKACLLRLRQFQGTQQPVVFDAFGDSSRRAVVSVIRNRSYQTLDKP
jgi:branched-chain amino acid transport system substrate-binding protein